MDVTCRPLTPVSSLLMSSTTTDGGGAAAQPSGNAGEISGITDGPDLVLASGVRVRRKRLGALRVGEREVKQALQGVSMLPFSDQKALAQLGIPIELVPVSQLEQLPGTTRPVVGVTRINGPNGMLRPQRIRIAALQAQVGSSVREAVQHEIGHALLVVSRQDTSEESAIAYAARY